MYFLWDSKISFLLLFTSTSKKYFNTPKSFVWNLVGKKDLKGRDPLTKKSNEWLVKGSNMKIHVVYHHWSPQRYEAYYESICILYLFYRTKGFIIRKKSTKKKTICLKIRKIHIIEFIFLFLLVMQKTKIYGLVPHNGKEILSIQHMLSKEINPHLLRVSR